MELSDQLNLLREDFEILVVLFPSRKRYSVVVIDRALHVVDVVAAVPDSVNIAHDLLKLDFVLDQRYDLVAKILQFLHLPARNLLLRRLLEIIEPLLGVPKSLISPDRSVTRVNWLEGHEVCDRDVQQLV